MSILFTNNAATALAAPLLVGGTSLTVVATTGSLFPNPTGSDVFYVTLANLTGSIEIVKVTARSTDTMTIVRAQDGTSALAWNAGDKVELRPNAVSMTAMTQKANNLSDLPSASTARTNLGLGTAATKDTGTSAGQVVILDGSAKLPAVDGSQLTNLASSVQAAVQSNFKNLSMSAIGNANQVVATIDEVMLKDSSNVYLTVRGISAVAVPVGSGTGTWNGTSMMLDTGSWATSTWYSMWVIATPAGSANWLFSTSATAPTMPAGYTYKARVGWVRTDSTVNKYPLRFFQYGRLVQYGVSGSTNVTTWPVLASGVQGSVSTPTYVAIAWANFAPSTASALHLLLNAGNVSSGTSSLINPNNAAGAAGINANSAMINHSTATGTGSSQSCKMIIESTNIYYAAQDTNTKLLITGWEDNL